MPYTTYNCDALTGGAARALDSLSVGDLTTGDRAVIAVSGEFLYFVYDSTATAAENVSTHPYVVRPDDYSSGGNWEEQETLGGIASANLTDDAEITFDTGKSGWGQAMAGDNEEYIEFRFTAAGAVTVISNSANAINTDTDGNLCVYDVGAGIAIKNRLGATKTIRYVVQYS